MNEEEMEIEEVETDISLSERRQCIGLMLQY